MPLSETQSANRSAQGQQVKRKKCKDQAFLKYSCRFGLKRLPAKCHTLIDVVEGLTGVAEGVSYSYLRCLDPDQSQIPDIPSVKGTLKML
jgi:hypothetical protein